MNEVRARAKAFYNALDFDRPINFGQDELVSEERAQPESLYVPSLHGGDGTMEDPVAELVDQIDYSESAGAYLFTGNRGTGKTTELMRLARELVRHDCEVFYVDIAEYLNLTQRLEISDFLMGMLGALSEKVSARFHVEVGKAGFFQRAWTFLQSEVKIEDVSLPAGPADLKAALVQTPHFKQELQRRTRGHVQSLVRSARKFVLEVVELVRKKRSLREDEKLKIVVIVDSVERLRGVGSSEDVREVFKSAEMLFGSHADLLRFMGLNVVYTIPPCRRWRAASGLTTRAAGSMRCRACTSTSAAQSPVSGRRPPRAASTSC